VHLAAGPLPNVLEVLEQLRDLSVKHFSTKPPIFTVDAVGTEHFFRLTSDDLLPGCPILELV
jgi:hypothetical protein